MFRKNWLLAGLASATILTAGVVPAFAQTATPAHAHGHAGHHRPNRMTHLADQLHLTPAQRQQIAAIAQKYRGQHKPPHEAANGQELKQILAAPKLDKAALKQFLDARVQAREAMIPTRVKMLAEMRAVLTDAQRQQLAQILSKPMPQHSPRVDFGKRMHDRVVKSLGLNASQAQAFDRLQAQLRAQRQSQGSATRQAYADFARTGDTGALTRALTANAQQMPTDALVDFAATLTPAQRAKALHAV
ncbi:MAG TPA: Spy/CpxP family protein refolding chaperone, partial [Oscillatoriaceae cyanobacterium]